MLAQTNCLERLACTLAALSMPHARERERQLHVFQNGLMRNKVIALEHKADAIVSVGIPIAVAEVLGRDAVDQQVAGIEMVESADDVEHRSFTRARGTQDGHELVIAKRQAYAVERHLRKRLRNIPFANISEIQHGRQPLPRRSHPTRLTYSISFFAGTSKECNEQKNGTARHVAHHPAHNIDDVTKGLSLCHIRTYCSLLASA